MSLYGALSAGIAGLSAQSQSLSAISNNIANTSTIGYKRVETRFAELVTDTAGAAAYSPGGVRTSTANMIDAQGSVVSSTNNTDLAISGSGFFVVRGSSSAASGLPIQYTRAGDFRPDAAGYLVNSNGYYLQGWALDSAGNRPVGSNDIATVQPINTTNIIGQAKETQNLTFGANLDSRFTASALVPSSTAPVASKSTSDLTVYDSLGNNQKVRLTWHKVGIDTWRLTASLPNGGGSLVASTPTPLMDDASVANAVIVKFNTDGTLNSMEQALATGAGAGITGNGTSVLVGGKMNMTFDFSASGASASQTIAFNFGTAGALGTGKSDGLGQYAQQYGSSPVVQDGAAFGKLTGVSIDTLGVVSALFSNGQTRKVYEIPLADFPNPNGLQADRGGVFNATTESGAVDLKPSNSAGVGQVSPGSLESSTVDIAQEFSNMIITQRAFSANGKVVKTADEMLTELLQIK
jgi:flagellar hook protein FlgE